MRHGLGVGAGRAEVGEGSDGRGQAVSSRGGKESAAAVAREMGRRVAGGRCWAGWAERPKRRRLLEQGRRGELGWGWCWAECEEGEEMEGNFLFLFINKIFKLIFKTFLKSFSI